MLLLWGMAALMGCGDPKYSADSTGSYAWKCVSTGAAHTTNGLQLLTDATLWTGYVPCNSCHAPNNAAKGGKGFIARTAADLDAGMTSQTSMVNDYCWGHARTAKIISNGDLQVLETYLASNALGW